VFTEPQPLATFVLAAKVMRCIHCSVVSSPFVASGKDTLTLHGFNAAAAVPGVYQSDITRPGVT